MESWDILRLCSGESVKDGNSQFETRENDFFFLRGGCGCCKTRGSGGGGGRARSGRDGGREETNEDDGEGVVKAADASVKGVRRAGICTVFEGAVLGRWSA